MAIEFSPFDYSARNGFAGNVLDRRAEKRGPNALGEALADPRARMIVACGPDMLHDPAAGGLALSIERARVLGAGLDDAILLGWDPSGAPWLAAELLPDRLITAGAAGCELLGLRPLALDPRFSAGEVGAAAQARSLIDWHHSHRFCSRCGAQSEMALAGYRRDCPACGTQHFPRTDPVVIMLVSDGERALLGRQARFAPGTYSCLAGFMEPGETVENAVRREVFEEAGITVGAVRYFASQPWPFVSSLMIGCHAQATSRDIDFDAEELEDCRWVTRGELERMVRNADPHGRTVADSSAIARKLIDHWLAEAG